MHTSSHHAVGHSGYAIPRGWIILGLALVSWAGVFAAWQCVAFLFGTIAA